MKQEFDFILELMDLEKNNGNPTIVLMDTEKNCGIIYENKF